MERNINMAGNVPNLVTVALEVYEEFRAYKRLFLFCLTLLLLQYIFPENLLRFGARV